MTDALTTLRQDLDARQAALELKMRALDVVTTLLDGAAEAGLAARVDQADGAGIKISIDLSDYASGEGELPGGARPGGLANRLVDGGILMPHHGQIVTKVVQADVPLATYSPAPAVKVVAGQAVQAWSDADLDELHRMRAAGKSYADIAANLGRTKSAVRAKLVSEKKADPGAAPAPSGKGAPWTKADDDKAARMYREGKPVAEIAAALGRPVPGTTFRLKKLREKYNITPRAGGARPDLKVSPSPKDTDRPSIDQAMVPPSADGGLEGQVDAARRSDAAPDQSGATLRPEQSLQAKPVSAGTAANFESLNFRQRAVATRLAGLSDSDWSADDDFDLADTIIRGDGIAKAVEDLERPKDDCLARWRKLCPNPTPESQADLMAVLRLRVAAARSAA